MRDEERFVRGGLPGPGRTPRRFASTGETLCEAAKRLGVAGNTILQRLSHGWSEQQALTLPKGSSVKTRGIPKGQLLGARPGVKLSPLTERETAIVQLLSEGFKPRELYESGFGVSLHALHSHIGRMQLKLDAFNTTHLASEALRKGFIK